MRGQKSGYPKSSLLACTDADDEENTFQMRLCGQFVHIKHVQTAHARKIHPDKVHIPNMTWSHEQGESTKQQSSCSTSCSKKLLIQ